MRDSLICSNLCKWSSFETKLTEFTCFCCQDPGEQITGGIYHLLLGMFLRLIWVSDVFAIMDSEWSFPNLLSKDSEHLQKDHFEGSLCLPIIFQTNEFWIIHHVLSMQPIFWLLHNFLFHSILILDDSIFPNCICSKINLLLSSISSYGYIRICLIINPLIDMWVIPSLWLL